MKSQLLELAPEPAKVHFRQPELSLTRTAGQSILLTEGERKPVVLTLLGTLEGDFLFLITSPESDVRCTAREMQQSETLRGGKIFLLHRGTNRFAINGDWVKLTLSVRPTDQEVEVRCRAPRSIKITRMELAQ